MRLKRLLVALILALPLAGCDFAPRYTVPVMPIPKTFKEAWIWQSAHPSDDLPRGQWWRAFNDSLLDGLEAQIETQNQDFAATLAAYDQARAYVSRAESAFYPSVAQNEQFSTNRQSDHRPLRGSNEPDHYGNNELAVEASYEVDIWGRVRDLVAASRAHSQASADMIESVRLGLEAELARDYVELRGLDLQAQLLRHTVTAYRQALDLTQARLQGKIASPIDTARAEVQLDNAKAQLEQLAGPRAQFLHAIATLIGVPASTFSIPPATKSLRLPLFPVGVPTTLLERRPDIAAAERDTAAANESIGVAKAAFFPRLTLNLAGGTQDTGLNLLSLQNSFWAVGPTVYLPLFDGGLRTADLTAAQAQYREKVARYKQTVLRALQEVEDDLASLHALKNEAINTTAAAVAAQRASALALALYRNGATNYLDVVTAQTAALDAQRLSLIIKARQLEASVALILALGGDVATHQSDAVTTLNE